MNRRMQYLATAGLTACAGVLILMLGGACSTAGGGGSKPKSFVRTYDDSNWRNVEIRDELKGEDVWRSIVDTVAAKYDLEVIEKDSFYLRTAFKYTYVVRKTVSENYRSRIVVKGDRDGKIVKIKVDSQWQSSTGWEQGYDLLLLEDIYSDIQGKVGRVVR